MGRESWGEGCNNLWKVWNIRYPDIDRSHFSFFIFFSFCFVHSFSRLVDFVIVKSFA